MEENVQTELDALIRTVFDLRVPTERDASYQVVRPAGIGISELGWLERLAEAVVQEVQLGFDLRLKTEGENPKEIEAWKMQVRADGLLERRKNYRLRIRVMVDDLFEKIVPLTNVTATVRAWKIQLADACAEAILDRFHLRPASSGPWAIYRQTLHEIGQKLNQALAHQELFLMTGRPGEIEAMRAMIQEANQAVQALAEQVLNQKNGF